MSIMQSLKPKRRVILFCLATVSALCAAGLVWNFERQSPEQRANAYYESGVKLAAQRDYVKATIELRKALVLKSDMLPAWRSLAEIEESNQHWDGVIESLRSILKLDPGDIGARVKLAKILVLAGRVYQALELTNAINDADKRNPTLLGLKAAVLYNADDKTRAVEIAKNVLAIEPGNADALVVLATDRLQSGDNSGALQVLESDAASLNLDLGVQLLKLKILAILGQTQQIESLLQKLIALHPEQIGLRGQLVKLYHDQNRDGDAERAARAMVEFNPSNPEAELFLVQFLNVVKGPKAAKQELIARINAGGDVIVYQLALADFEFAQGNFTDAEQLMNDVVRHAHLATHARAAKLKLAEMDLQRNKIDAADALVSEILRNDRDNTKALKIRASVRIVRGQLDSAISDLQSAMISEPRSPDLMMLLALAYERNGSVALAEKQYSDAVKVSNFNPKVGRSYAGFLERRGNSERAEQFLSELSKRSPGNVEILSALARIELARQNWVGARETADTIRSDAHDASLADQVLGAALYGQQKYDESAVAFQSAFDASPTAVEPMVSLVRALVRAQKTDRAMAFLDSVLATNPNNAEALVLMGSLQLAGGSPQQALEKFKLAIEKEPRNVSGYRALAELYASEKKPGQAIEVLRSGLKLRPENVALRQVMAGALEQVGQYDAAITEYERILGEQPESVTAANNLASLLSDHRDDKASLDKAQSLAAMLRASPIPQFKDTLGWISYRRGNYAGAIAELEQAATALPKMPLVRYHLAMSYIAAGRVSEASSQLKAALLLAPDSGLEQKIREALIKVASR